MSFPPRDLLKVAHSSREGQQLSEGIQRHDGEGNATLERMREQTTKAILNMLHQPI